jgi:hypothetical protein
MKRAMTDHIRHAAQFLGLWLLIAVVLAFGTPELARRPPEHRASLSICPEDGPRISPVIAWVAAGD